MIAKVKIDAGICGFHTKVVATSEDCQFVQFNITTSCDKIRNLSDSLQKKGNIDAFCEISQKDESVIMNSVRTELTGCCAGCAVAVGIFKAMQVAAGLSLPKDINIEISKS
jgi:hypothetical protein